MPDPAWVTPRAAPFVGPESGGGGFLPDWANQQQQLGWGSLNPVDGTDYVELTPLFDGWVLVQVYGQIAGPRASSSIGIDPQNNWWVADQASIHVGTISLDLFLMALVPPGMTYGVSADTRDFGGGPGSCSISSIIEIPSA